ncbi:MAG: hypothetical protein IKP98_03225 [Bacilli bacterium]|nr:hypothetical protein [Bacilli bacterium]
MASTIIHMAVANELNKKLNRDNNLILLGGIAPDLGKIATGSKIEAHFQDTNNDIPNIKRFLNKYSSKMNDDFVMGYFIHLYTDYLWFKYFIPELFNQEKELITKLDGTKVKCTENIFTLYVYNDYTNLNTRLLDEYNMDLSIFYNELPELNNIITEIPMDKLNLLINESSYIIENTKEKKEYIFDIEDIKTFISTSTNLIYAYLKEKELI